MRWECSSLRSLSQLSGVEVVHMIHASFNENRLLDSVGKDGPVGDQVGVDPRMGLDVGVLGPKERLGVVGG